MKREIQHVIVPGRFTSRSAGLLTRRVVGKGQDHAGSETGAPAPRSAGRTIWITLILIALAFAASAQPNPPQIGYVYPAGGSVGTTVELKVGGQFLDGVTNAFITGDDVAAVVTDFHRPMPQGQFTRLRDRLQELREKRQATLKDSNSTNVWTTADETEMTTIRERMLKNPPNRNATVAIADVATVRITIATNATVGDRELRLGTPTGLSNPLKFCVGALPEFVAPAAAAPNPDADRMRRQFNLPAQNVPTTNVARVTLPTMINGQILPGEVDRYRFRARQGQQLVIIVSARDLIPYLADAVPGWFQATVALYDAKGKEVAYNDDFRFRPDPVLQFEIPRDGDYEVEIKDSIYRGREDFVYRIALGELPFVTSIFPLGGRVGEITPVELQGWNLPTNQFAVKAASAGIALTVVGTNALPGTLLPFAGDSLPETTEIEPNNTAATAQRIDLPIIINGRITAPGDMEVFQIEGRAGEEIVAEVLARRLNSPLDSILTVFDGAGQPLGRNDDFEDRASGLNTHHADSYLRVKLPEDGKYFLHLADAQRQGGPEYGYRLRLSAPQPDFELRAVPSSLSVRPGGSVPLRIVALRKEGFTNEIAITLQGAPRGFKLSGAQIPANCDQVRLTVTAPPSAAAKPVALQLEGRALRDGTLVVHAVSPADDMMQAFFYRHLVPAQEWQVLVSGWAQRATPQWAGKGPVQIPVGGTVGIEIGLPTSRVAQRFHLELDEPPDGITIQKITPTPAGMEVLLQSDAATTKVGLKGNLVLSAFAENNKAAQGQQNRRRAPVAFVPAIPFEVVAP